MIPLQISEFSNGQSILEFMHYCSIKLFLMLKIVCREHTSVSIYLGFSEIRGLGLGLGNVRIRCTEKTLKTSEIR